jgi:hypothetical protein
VKYISRRFQRLDHTAKIFQLLLIAERVDLESTAFDAMKASSAHERSDIRDAKVPDVAALIRATLAEYKIMLLDLTSRKVVVCSVDELKAQLKNIKSGHCRNQIRPRRVKNRPVP